MKFCKVFLGIPGSGKSTFSRRLLTSTPMVPGMVGVIVSADHYFEREGKYSFDAAKLGAAHGACWTRFTQAIDKGNYLVIVDNTNVTFHDLKKYYEYALEAGYDVEVVAMECPPDIASARNVHSVPEETVEKMHTRFLSCLDNVHKHKWNVRVHQGYTPPAVEPVVNEQGT